MVVTELAAVKELVTDVWVLPVQSVDALLSSSSSSEISSSLPLPSSSSDEEEDGSLSLLSRRSKCRSARFHDATARERKAGAVEDLLDPLVDDEDPRILLLSEAILPPKVCLFFFVVPAPLLFWGAILVAILVGAKEQLSGGGTSCADFSVSSSSLAMEAYRRLLGFISFEAAPAGPRRGAPTGPVPAAPATCLALEGTKVAARLVLGPTAGTGLVLQDLDLASRARARSRTDRGRPEVPVVASVDVLMVDSRGVRLEE